MTEHGDPTGRRRALRVLAWPAFRKRAANPHAALLAAELQNLGVDIDDWTPWRALSRNVDLWHIHHPDTVVYPRSLWRCFIGTVVFALLLKVASWRRIRVIWTIHDFDNNDGLHPQLEKQFWRYYIPAVDGFICLTEGSITPARKRFPQLASVPGFAVEHGHYLDAYPAGLTREQARQQLDIPAEATVLLHFGLMRPYKNVPHLIDTFKQLNDPNSILLLAGEPYDQEIETTIRERSGNCPQVRLALHWVPPDQVQVYFAASDLVVLPYRRILNSGAALLALSFARPILVPALGNMREQQQRFGKQWIRIYEGELDSEILAGASQSCGTPSDTAPNLARLGWHDIAERTLQIYNAVLSTAKRSTHLPLQPAALRGVEKLVDRGPL
jgi:beta-1,4-mannosyltransferase